MTTIVDTARALSLPFLDEVSLYDQLVAEYGIDPLAEALLRWEDSTNTADASPTTDVVVEPVTVEAVAVTDDAVEPTVNEDPAEEPVEPPNDEEPQWENLSEEHDGGFTDGFEVLRDLSAVLDPEDVTTENLAAALAAEEQAAVEDDDDPAWQETVLPEPTEADVKANQTLLEEIGVYFGDDLPEMPPFEHDQPQQP